MFLLMYLKAILTWAAILCGFVAAYLWFKASTVVVSEAGGIHNPGIELGYTDEKTGKEVLVVATAMEQSRLNKIAAIWTALAVLSQALATIVP